MSWVLPATESDPDRAERDKQKPFIPDGRADACEMGTSVSSRGGPANDRRHSKLSCSSKLVEEMRPTKAATILTTK